MDTGKLIDFKDMAYDLIADLDPKDPDHLSNIVEDLIYAVQDTMYDYAANNQMEDPEPFI